MSSMSELLPRHAKAQLELRRMLSRLKAGDKIDSERELAARLDVSRPTVRRAMESLIREGVIESQQGRGTFLRQPVSADRPERRATKLLGMVMPTVFERSIAAIVEGAERAAGAADYSLVLAHDHGELDRQVEQLQRMAEREVDGVLTYPDGENVGNPVYIKAIQRLVDAGTPVVLLDRYIPELDVSCVMTDNVYGGYLATQRLVMSGRRRLALLSFGPTAGSAERQRLKGYQDAMRDADLPLEPVRHAELGMKGLDESGRAAVAGWLAEADGHPPFDAIVCFEPRMALGAYLALRDAGLKVPEDVALAGYRDIVSETSYTDPWSLTGVEQPLAEMGTRGIELLLEEIRASTPPHPRQILLKPSLRSGSSCGYQATNPLRS